MKICHTSVLLHSLYCNFNYHPSREWSTFYLKWHIILFKFKSFIKEWINLGIFALWNFSRYIFFVLKKLWNLTGKLFHIPCCFLKFVYKLHLDNFNYGLFLCTILYWVKNKQGFFFGLSVMTFQYLLYFPQPLHY